MGSDGIAYSTPAVLADQNPSANLIQNSSKLVIPFVPQDISRTRLLLAELLDAIYHN